MMHDNMMTKHAAAADADDDDDDDDDDGDDNVDLCLRYR